MQEFSENYAPKGKVLWDSWFINRGDECHMFHLQACPARNVYVRPEDNVSIGHAVSKDLIHWEELPTALKVGGKEEWDNDKLWSGCAAEKDGSYYLYYTGKNNTPGTENIQKIGVATSDDLITWTKHPNNPIVEADFEYYEMDNNINELGNAGSWRDPFVFKDRHSDKRYMTISAIAKEEGNQYNACVAIAESDDMVNWKVLPPIFSPGVYDEIEVSRVIFHNDLYYLFFTTHDYNYKPSFAEESGGAFEGLHCYYSDNLFGGYKPVNQNGVVFDNGNKIYDIRVLNIKDDEFVGLGWLNYGPDGKFIGKLSDPIKIKIEGDRISRV